MKIALAQLNPTVGDIRGNLEKIHQTLLQVDKDTDLIIFSEMVVTGYPAQDLLDKPWFREQLQQAKQTLIRLSSQYPQLGLLIGTPLPYETSLGRGLHNSALLLCGGEVVFEQHKQFLPTYDVFDDARHFDSAQHQEVVEWNHHRLGITICEDIWNDDSFWPKPLYSHDPVDQLVAQGADILINLAASPFELGKQHLRYQLVAQHIQTHKVPFILVNQVGGNDELIFDGHSFAMNAQGELITICQGFQEDLRYVDLKQRPIAQQPQHNDLEDLEKALILGIRDYFAKCNTAKALLGLSGGIDSAVVAYLACQALGATNVLGISMPSPYSSRGSVDDSQQLATTLDMPFKVIDIATMMAGYDTVFAQEFAGQAKDTTEENIQARIRGNILMAFSNKEGRLLLTTGNKSEVAVGYCTLYGDMCGGLAAISDVPKTMVYDLARHINREREIIPQAIIDKAPSAELRPDQKDEDSLPPYPMLDAILEAYLVKHLSYADIVNLGYEAEIVKWVLSTVNRNEYKRRQMPPGLKVTSKAFGSGRRFPIAARYRF